MKNILIALLSLVLFTTCKKEDAADPTPAVPDCDANNYARLDLSNSSVNAYSFYVNGAWQQDVAGGAIVSDFHLAQGNSVQLKAVQLEGFVLFPTIVTNTLNVVECSDYAFQFP